MEGSNRGEGGSRESDAATRGELERELQRLEAADPFTALGIAYDADDRAVRVAFLAATKRLHPNRFARFAAPVRALANEVFLRVKDAYAALEDGDGRARVLTRIGRAPTAPIGEGSRSVPVAFPNVPRVTSTPPGGTRLADIRPPTPEPRPLTPEPRIPEPRPLTPEPRIPEPRPLTPPLVAARPTTQRLPSTPAVTVDDVRKQVLDRERKVEEEFNAAVQKLEQGLAEVARREFHRLAVADPGDKRYRVWMHQAKGREHQAAGRIEEARTEYRRALGLDDGFAAARAALASLEPGGDKPSGGLFSRLFRK